MGWSSGTEIFDAMAEELTNLSIDWTAVDYHESFMEPLIRLNKILSNLDWDNQCESNYWEHPVIGKILGNDEVEEGYEQ